RRVRRKMLRSESRFAPRAVEMRHGRLLIAGGRSRAYKIHRPIAASRRSLEVDELWGRKDPAEFERKRSHVNPLHVSGANPVIGSRVGQVEAIAGVWHEDHVPTQVGAHAHRRRDAHVRRNAEYDDVFRAKLLQFFVEVRADESGVDALRDEWLAVQRFESGAKRVAWSAWREGRTGLHRVMADVDDRPTRLPPGGEQGEAIRIPLLVP